MEANSGELTELIIEGPSFSHIDIHYLSQLKGQILAYKDIIDIKEFLSELTEERVNDETKHEAGRS